MKDNYEGFFYNRFAKGFYVSLIAINYPAFVAAFSVTGDIDRRISVISEHFIARWPTEHFIFTFGKIVLQIGVGPFLAATFAYLLMNWGNEIFIKVENLFFTYETQRASKIKDFWKYLENVHTSFISIYDKASSVRGTFPFDDGLIDQVFLRHRELFGDVRANNYRNSLMTLRDDLEAQRANYNYARENLGFIQKKSTKTK